MSQELQFREYYGHLVDDELARIALTDQLVPEAQRALQEVLQKRGLTDLSEYKAVLDQAAAHHEEEGKQALLELKLHCVVVGLLYPSIWLLYHATGWLGIHNGDVRAVITIVFVPIAFGGLLAFWRRMRKE